MVDNKDTEEPKVQDASKVDAGHTNFESENGNLPSKKKRKFDGVVSLRKKVKDDTLVELGNGEVIQGGKTEAGDKESQLKRHKVAEPASADDQFKKIKWKKLITSALKSVRILYHSVILPFVFYARCDILKLGGKLTKYSGYYKLVIKI